MSDAPPVSAKRRTKSKKIPESPTITINDLPVPLNANVVVTKVDEVAAAPPRRRTKTNKSLPKTEVTTDQIKDGDPLAVRDQLMRDYFDLRRNSDEVVQKLCALVFKHH